MYQTRRTLFYHVKLLANRDKRAVFISIIIRIRISILLRTDMSYSDSDDHFEHKGNMALTLAGRCTDLGKN